jgi:2,3-dihydroxybenzoate-AMP ligase
MGERICAFVIVRDDATVTLDDVRSHLSAAGLARFKLPERLVVRDALPRTASGKVRKSTLREELARAAP